MLTSWAFLGYDEIRRQPDLVPAETSIKNFVEGFPFLLGYEPSRRKCIHCKFFVFRAIHLCVDIVKVDALAR